MMLFPGLIFILLDYQITVGTAVIGLLPEFIGYFLIMKALEKREDPWRHGAFGLMLVSVVLFVADLVDKGTMAQVGFAAVGLAAEIAMLVLLHHLIRKNERLRTLFPVLACIRVLCALLGWIPLVGTVCAVANAVVAVCFLIAAYPSMVKER